MIEGDYCKFFNLYLAFLYCKKLEVGYEKNYIIVVFGVIGVLSFAAPSYVDVNRIKKDGYDIDVNDSDSLAFTKKGSDMNVVITMYFTNDGNP